MRERCPRDARGEPGRGSDSTPQALGDDGTAMLTRAATTLAAATAAAAIIAYHVSRRRAPLRNSRRTVYYAPSAFVHKHIANEVLGIVKQCFPTALDDDDNASTIVSCLCGFHDEDACTWLLIMDDTSSNNHRVVALALVIPYHDRLYLSTVGVAPHCQRQGLGTLLLRSASAYAKEVLRLNRLSGSVDATREMDASRLQRYYEALGGQMEPPPPMGGDAFPGRTTLRIDAPSGPTTARGVRPPVPLLELGGE